MALSSCDTRYHDGIVFHAALSGAAPNTLPMMGFWVAAKTRGSTSGRSAAKTVWNCAGSTYRNPALSGRSAAPSGAGYLSLVYIAAVAPEAGEATGAFGAKQAAPPDAALRPQKDRRAQLRRGAHRADSEDSS